jgi:hypothetical protein
VTSRTFVVEVEGARVAVHGTAFRWCAANRCGRVGHRGHRGRGRSGDSGGYFLRAGTRKFAKDGLTETKRARGARAHPRRAEAEWQRQSLAARRRRWSCKALIRSGAATRCFANDGALGEVRVQVRTELDVSFGADGRVRALGFEPPLSPAVTECVQRETLKVRVPESALGGTGQRALLLGS